METKETCFKQNRYNSSALALEWCYIYLVSYKWISNTVPHLIAEDYWSDKGGVLYTLLKFMLYNTVSK